eukprot:2700491-Rhodomonas_salina.1
MAPKQKCLAYINGLFASVNGTNCVHKWHRCRQKRRRGADLRARSWLAARSMDWNLAMPCDTGWYVCAPKDFRHCAEIFQIAPKKISGGAQRLQVALHRFQ